MTKKKREYNKKRLSAEVRLLWDAWHNLKGPFTGWEKTTNSNSVRFESTFKFIRKKRITIEYIEEYKVAIIMPPLSDDPKLEFKVILGPNSNGAMRPKLRNLIKPIVARFISRNY